MSIKPVNTVQRVITILAISLGLLATTAQATVIPINVVSISGVNGGLASGGFSLVNDFTPSGGNLLLLNNYSVTDQATGMTLGGGASGISTAPSGFSVPTRFGNSALINNSYNFSSAYFPTSFKTAFSVSPDFGPGSFLGFKDALGRFGYIEVTWNSTSSEYYILSAAYESDVGVGITTPAGAAAVPEIDTLAGTGALTLLGFSLALAGERRRRTV